MRMPSVSRVLSNSSNAARKLIEPTFEVSELSFTADWLRLASQKARSSEKVVRGGDAGNVQDVLS